ncbi:family 2 glycosyl transferase [Calothrix sp. NIES-2100]|uniref:glycosyltransferase family A protein n=1 Tax=Calothrix sp. NIES-2100 TaxID=1954172 RepID=UPI000B611D19|nr:family 2 glycosyl transferase [Calothrix sp. NIES-2100]
MVNASELLQLAIENHRANRLEQAEMIYHQVLETQPDHPEALYRLGTIAQQRGNLLQAEELLNAALAAQPQLFPAWFSLGNLQQAQGKLAAAVVAYQQAIALKPDAAPIYNNLGYTFQQQGQLDEAVSCYQKALEIQPNCTEAEVNLGNILHSQGKLLAEQKSYYEQLNQQLAMERETAGDWQIAAAYYQKAVELNPDNGELYLKLGRVYQQQKDFPGAIAAYRQGLKLLNPHYAQAVAAYQEAGSPQDILVTPPIPHCEVTVGAYQFPGIPPVTNPEQPRPFWSVVIPVYNRTDYLLECLASVLVQWPGAEQMEILVMDNASTKPLFDLVNSLGGGVIRYYRNQQNVGALPNHNVGVSVSRGEWIHILHDDDCVFPNFYARLQHSLEDCPDSVGAAFTGFEYINETGTVVNPGEPVSLFGEHKGILQNFLQIIGITLPLQVPAVVIRRVTYEHRGGYHPELVCAPEWELYKRIAVVYDWLYEPGSLACYRLHTNNMTDGQLVSGKLAAYIRQNIEITESYLPTDLCSEITRQARSYNFNYCLANAAIPLKAGNLAGALLMLQEILKIDRSPQSLAKLFFWLTQDEAAPLRDEIVSKVLLVNHQEIQPLTIATEPKHLQPAITA